MATDPLFQAIRATFTELGAAGDAPIVHTLQLKDRFFVGHCYRCGEQYAIWKPGSVEIEFFAANARPLRTVRFEEAQTKAA